MTNKTNVIFISCNSLNEVKESLINVKLYKTLGVINISEIKHWDKIKGISYSENLTSASHLNFAFTTTNLHNILNFSLSLYIKLIYI